MKKEKLNNITLIVLAGFVISVLACYIAATFPDAKVRNTTFLFGPNDRFNDFFNVITKWNQYLPGDPTPFRNYFPFSYLIIKPFVLLNNKWLSLAAYMTISVSFIILYFKNKCTVNNGIESAKNIIILSCMSFPVLFLLDRANIEVFLFIFLCFFIEFYKKGNFLLSALFLSFAIAMKAYPAVFLVLLFSDKKYREIIVCILSTLLLSFASLLFFDGSIQDNINRMLLNMKLFTHSYISYPRGLDFGCSIFGILKEINIYMIHTDIFVLLKYYVIIIMVLFIFISLYVIIYENQLWKKIFILTATMLIFPHISSDYKLVHLFIPLFLYLDAQKEKSDTLYIIILGLLLVPKNIRIIDRLYGGVFLDPLLIIFMVSAILHETLSGLNNHWDIFKNKIKEHFRAMITF